MDTACRPGSAPPSRQRQGPLTGAELWLTAIPAAVRQGRMFARHHMERWGLPADDAELVASELLTNAVNATSKNNPATSWSGLQGLAEIRVWLLLRERAVIIIVCDTDTTPPAPKEPGLGEESGRGLLIVQALCRRWGWCPFEHGQPGKAVWAELTVG